MAVVVEKKAGSGSGVGRCCCFFVWGGYLCSFFSVVVVCFCTMVLGSSAPRDDLLICFRSSRFSLENEHVLQKIKIFMNF